MVAPAKIFTVTVLESAKAPAALPARVGVALPTRAFAIGVVIVSAVSTGAVAVATLLSGDCPTE